MNQNQQQQFSNSISYGQNQEPYIQQHTLSQRVIHHNPFGSDVLYSQNLQQPQRLVQIVNQPEQNTHFSFAQQQDHQNQNQTKQVYIDSHGRVSRPEMQFTKSQLIDNQQRQQQVVTQKVVYVQQQQEQQVVVQPQYTYVQPDNRPLVSQDTYSSVQSASQYVQKNEEQKNDETYYQNICHETINFLAFNQDNTCFAVATNAGFKIFNTDPFEQIRTINNLGPLKLIKMIFKSNLVLFVGDSENEKYKNKYLIVWDDSNQKILYEIGFRSPILNVLVKNDIMVVVLERKIVVYNFNKLRILETIDTAENEFAACALNMSNERTILVYPSISKGMICLVEYGNDLQKTRELSFKPHTSGTYCLQLNYSGTKLATASEKGTIIRIFDTENCKKIQELRRGTEYTEIKSMSFHPSGSLLAINSISGTIHIFIIKDEGFGHGKNKSSNFKFLSALSSTFGQEQSYVQFRIMDKYSKTGFLEDPSLIYSITTEGNYYLASFDLGKGGEAQSIHEMQLITDEDQKKQE